MSQTRARLLALCQSHPQAKLQDILKFLHQSAFGCEHLLSDPAAAEAQILDEAPSARPAPPERLDGPYARLPLSLLQEGLSPQTLTRLFLLSATPDPAGREKLEEKLAVLQACAKEEWFPFSEQEVADSVEKWREAGFPPCRHSEAYRAAYAPAYRVVRSEFLPLLPLLIALDRANGRGVLAIDGPSASGKTSLAALLSQLYDATVFHADDFFLRPEQRTETRLNEPGGNLDRERLIAEVLEPMRQGRIVCLRRFDCSNLSLRPPEPVVCRGLVILEGSYSSHPAFAPYFCWRAFLEIPPAEQRRRILQRNGSAAPLFFERWIPLERRYFEETNAPARCDFRLPAFGSEPDPTQ